MTIPDLARDYHAAVHASADAAVDAEEEAQLTTPVSNLFTGLAAEAGLGELRMIRETRLDHTRPDFAVVVTRARRTRQKGFVELKAPGISVDASTWSGRNARQWAKMAVEAEILIICNGVKAQIYRNGEPYDAPADLPFHGVSAWRADGLVRLLRLFVELNPTPIVSVRDLSARLAVRTADLRDRLLWLLDETGGAATAAKGGYRAWRQHVQPTASPRDFADGVSQVLAYGMVIAALGAAPADTDGDGTVSVAEARVVLRRLNPVLAAAFAPLMDKPALTEAAEVELGALETLIGAIDADRVNVSADPRGEPWLYFYEDFLDAYDPEERRQAGVYYTPVDIVKGMTNIVSHLLVTRFGRRLGFSEPSVVTLDPAAGSGAFPLAVIDKAVERASAVRGRAGPSQAAANLANSLFAFELLPGPYSVAYLRLTQRLGELHGGSQRLAAQVVLTDTLESPFQPTIQAEFFGDAEVLAAEQQRAQQIKLEQQVTVVIGNPPYRRVERDIAGRGSGGWVVDGAVPGRGAGRSLFADILDVARANTIFSHHASLYNLYVYFWRWALWKAFEAHGAGPGVVAFITGSSWLAGPGFVGLRQLVRQLADDIWVLDLGGDNHGANPEENVFAIETPVAVVVVARDGASNRTTPARTRYRRVRGTAAQKLAAMTAITASADPLDGEWIDAPSDWMAPLVPPTGDAEWTAMPLLADIFPWQQPGCKFGRTWPIAPSPELLSARWERLAAAPREQKPGLFFTATAGRSVDTRADGYPRLRDTTAGDPSEPVERYGYRSFDRQWAFNDPRMAKTESPSLWQSKSDKQVFLGSILTAELSMGPALTATACVPDLHYFNGRGGKDIIPLWRDRAATAPNLPDGLDAALGTALGIAPPGVEDVAAYVYALLSASAYQTRFADALRTPGLRIPLTADATLWREAVEAGRYRLWLHTYAERFRDPASGRGAETPLVEWIGWEEPVTRIPRDRSEIGYDPEAQMLTIADGAVTGVRPEVWTFQVSGMEVVSKWLGYRTAKGAGRAASSTNELDRIRPTAWPDAWNDELLDLIRVLTLTLDGEAAHADLLARICDGPLIEAGRLPKPTPAERQPPATLARTSVMPPVEGSSRP